MNDPTSDRHQWYLLINFEYIKFMNSFLSSAPFPYPLKMWDNFWFTDIFRGYRNGKLGLNGSTQCFCYCHCLVKSRSSHSEMLLRRGVLKICSKCTGEHPWRSVISIKLLCNFIEIILRHGFSPVNLLHIYRAPFPRNTSW